MTSDSKRTTQWPLRFQSPEEFPNLIKFSECVEWGDLVANENQLMLYFKEEELKEEEKEKNAVKDEEYYKRRRRQRYTYRKKQTLVLENSPKDIHFEGRECNLDLVEMVSEGSVNQNKSKNKEDFRYVLLQFVKREGSNGSHDPEINVIPVGNMYALRKTGTRPDETLDEIDKKFIEERESVQKQIARYNKLSRALAKKSIEEGTSEGSDGKDSFDYALGKAFSKKKSDSQKTKISFVNSDVRDGNVPNVAINENGIDYDELKEFDWCKGEYNVRYADDEEEHITVEQQQVVNREEQEISSSLRFDDKFDSDSDEDNEEDEDDEENGTAGEDTSYNTTGSRSGYVNNDMLDGATKLRKELLHSQLEQQKMKEEYNKVLASQLPSNVLPTKSGPEIAATNTLKSAMKRKLNENAEKIEEKPKKQVKIVNTETTSVSNEFDLSDDGIKMYIQHRGGRVALKDIYEVFKSKIKELSQKLNDKSAGKKTFLEIIGRVAITIEDPILGNALVLKESPSS